ncbi:hypothetical protein D3C72_953010 [compost metagenome]
MRQGTVISAWACASSAFDHAACWPLPSARPAEIAARSAWRSFTEAFISTFMSSVSMRPVARRSRIWSPMATPMRKASLLPAVRKRPKGRFWIGKSVPATLAAATQLRSFGSWVALSAVMEVFL